MHSCCLSTGNQAGKDSICGHPGGEGEVVGSASIPGGGHQGPCQGQHEFPLGDGRAVQQVPMFLQSLEQSVPSAWSRAKGTGVQGPAPRFLTWPGVPGDLEQHEVRTLNNCNQVEYETWCRRRMGCSSGE